MACLPVVARLKPVVPARISPARGLHPALVSCFRTGPHPCVFSLGWGAVSPAPPPSGHRPGLSSPPSLSWKLSASCHAPGGHHGDAEGSPCRCSPPTLPSSVTSTKPTAAPSGPECLRQPVGISDSRTARAGLLSPVDRLRSCRGLALPVCVEQSGCHSSLGLLQSQASFPESSVLLQRPPPRPPAPRLLSSE